LLRAILQGGRPGETYNIGGDSERENIAVVRAICDVLDELKPDPTIGSRRSLMQFVKDRPGHDRRYAVNTAKIRRELGWTPSITFENGIRKTVAWYLENLEWVEEVRSGAYQDWLELNYAER
jgi:dTDP-glucose 4,6-dehydratase